tara:strand:+ start:9 stop:2531 length:2523 start_codon:yes stop_codon:yes gene_type:complete
MADKTPVRVVFNASNVATGLAEFQSGDTIPVANGGTGLTSIGSAGQILKVNAAGNALEFGAEGDISITNLVAPSNADLTFSTSGTGNIVLDAITLRGTTLSAADSTKITIAEALDVTGALTASGLAFPTSDGSANQFLKTDGSGNLSFADVSLGDFSFTGSTISNSSNADLSIQPSGTGDVVISGIRINGTTLDSSDSTGININENVVIDGNLTVEGTVDFQDQNISNVGSLSLDSISGDADSNTSITFSGSDVITMATGGSTAATFNADQTTSFSGAVNITTTTTGASLLITTTEDSNSAAPVIELKRNSSSPADADYLGRLTFKGENDADQAVTYARISGKVLDASDGTEDGAIEFNTMKAGSATISARLNSDELKLLNGTTLDVDGSGTFAGSVTATSLTTNTISSNGSNADLSIQPSGTGDVLISSLRINGTTLDSSDSTKVTIAEAVDITGALTFSGFTLPTSDGSDGQALVTDGSKTLSFGTVGAGPVSDDSAASVVNDKMITSTARTIDSFHSTFQDSVLYYVVSNDFSEDAINIQKVSVCHNDSDAFISAAGAKSGSNSAGTDMTSFTASVDNSMVRVKAASTNAVGGSLSFYKFGLGDNTSTGTSNNVIISQNTDVDSAAESLVTFAHASFRGAKLFISINNNSKTEVGNVEALVVHDGSDAFISQFGGIQSGNQPMLTLTAAISGSNVVVSAAGHEPNLRVTVHAIMLKDTMTSNDGTFSNAEAIAPVTISSSATVVDELIETTANGAVYYLVSKNASEGEFAVNEVFFAMGGGDITVASGPFVSTKGTNQLAFSADYKDDVENTGRLLVSSTSGASTTVSAYRINALAK